MTKLSSPFTITENVGRPSDNRYALMPADIDKLPKWNKVQIESMVEATSKNNSKFSWITFVGLDANFRHRMAVFSSKDISPLAIIFGIKRITDTSQLEGRELWVTFGKNTGRDGTIYAKINSYSTRNPDEEQGSIQGADLDLPQNGNANANGVPF